MFDRIDFQRIFTAGIGAALLSTACVVGAVGPAKAAETAPLTIASWQSAVDRQIARNLRDPQGAFGRSDHAVTRIAVRFDDHGAFDCASVATPSGSPAADREALRTARSIRYPVLPAGLRGQPQTVSMQVYFGDGSDVARQGSEADHLMLASRAAGAIDDTRTASR